MLMKQLRIIFCFLLVSGLGVSNLPSALAAPNATATTTIPTSAVTPPPASQTTIDPAPAITANTDQQTASPPVIIPPPPHLNAKGFVLMDAKTGDIIASKNMNEHMAPASLTKMMALYLASAALADSQIKLSDKVRISTKAWRTGGSRMFIRAGTFVPVSDLISGIVVDSGNDATVALAQYLGGSTQTFTQLMNQEAAALGMKNTHYMDPTGLPHNDHYSTPYDIAILAHAIINNYPQYYYWYKQKWFTWDGIKQSNRNRLLWRDPRVDGIKTGHTQEAGYCLVASAKYNGMRLISVIMGTPTDADRDDFNERLLNYGFRFYNTYTVYQANKPITEARVWVGSQRKVALGVSHNIVITIPKGKYQELKAHIRLNKTIKAPVTKGKVYGHITLMLNNKTLTQQPLVALESVLRGGLWTRLSDYVSLTFHRLFSSHSESKNKPTG